MTAPLDEHLSWKYHLSELSKKLARTCGMFFKIRNLLPFDVLLCLYNALFLSFLQYGLIVWGQTHASYTEPIFRLQKKLSESYLFSLACLPHFPSSMILNFSDFLIFSNSGSQPLSLNLSTRHHLIAFITFSYLIHLFINIPLDRPVMESYI